MIGVWRSAEDTAADSAPSSEQWVFTAGGDRTLLLRIESGEGEDLRFVARFFSLGGAVLMDLYPDRAALPENIRDFSGVYFLPVHMAARAEFGSDRLILRFLDGEWLKARLDRGDPRPAYALTEKGFVLLTGPTEEIRSFPQENLEEAFTEVFTVELVRAEAP